jgi:group I intron endonuclease
MDTYKATNTMNGKFYIGSTTNFSRRKEEHLRSKESYPFQNALRKKPGAFEWEVWSDDSDEPILEQALLDMWFGKGCCYNLNSSAKHPPSSKGRSPSPETRAKTSATLMGHPVSDETREKIGLASKSRVPNVEFTQEQQRDKRGDKNPRARGIVLTHIKSQRQEMFSCMVDACSKYGLSSSHLSQVAKGERKSHKGFTAEYLG